MKLSNADTKTLRTFLAQERRKFVLALQYGSSASDLEEIRDTIKEIQRLITEREKTETILMLNRTNQRQTG